MHTESRSDTVLVHDRVLDAFERSAERQKTIAVFILGLLIGTIYGVAVTYLNLHR